MNELKWLENELKSWEPRRPSAGIERRLFPKPARAMGLLRAMMWLSPATACLFLALVSARPQGDRPGAAQPASMVAMILSNQTCASLLQAPENRVERASFQWTNNRESKSNLSFTPLIKL